MTTIPRSAVHRVIIDACLDAHAKRATIYLAPDTVVNATRLGRFFNDRSRRLDVRLTIGKPNYAQRRFIALCKRAGEPFPMKKMQLQFDRKK